MTQSNANHVDAATRACTAVRKGGEGRELEGRGRTDAVLFEGSTNSSTGAKKLNNERSTDIAISYTRGRSDEGLDDLLLAHGLQPAVTGERRERDDRHENY